MEFRMDFLNCLDHDTSMKILRCLEDPSDLVRASYVSRYWRDFASEVGCSKFVEWETLKREHKAYAFLAQACLSFPFDDCIKDAISASSTDNYPEESICNTLRKGDRVGRRASYWSSKGQHKAAVPETLVYKLVADICVITEINIQPFQAYFQQGSPIYSAASVRFHLGHPKCPMDDTLGEPLDNCADDKFIWTYSSPEFPMAQESRLQNFKLPEPVVCIGGILQIELLRRVQRQEMDGLFYICVAHVQVKGRPLSSAFGVEILGPSGKFVLKALSSAPPSSPPPSLPEDDALYHGVPRHGLADLEQVVNGLGVGVLDEDWNSDDDEGADEMDDELAF
ncbi:PREDICTED: F-box protein At4g00755 isoform X2 [Populus euphratica]|uniref:F-box protein At4g00755 isoform X2 n=1 Tax=Populus euphratica TaxID=75702 RepID=A0AAJ6XY73_POPEU|nr:PREDICTED: F-box protein At4g00755 isoform X2 [Populus euphratica]